MQTYTYTYTLRQNHTLAHDTVCIWCREILVTSRTPFPNTNRTRVQCKYNADDSHLEQGNLVVGHGRLGLQVFDLLLDIVSWPQWTNG